MLTFEMRVKDNSVIKLDCINKQVYGFEEYGRYIFASDYDGGNQRMIFRAGVFFRRYIYHYIFGVFNGSLYFVNYDGSSINEMYVSNENVRRKIAVDGNNYYDLIVVHNSLQPLGKL